MNLIIDVGFDLFYCFFGFWVLWESVHLNHHVMIVARKIGFFGTRNRMRL